MYWVCGVNLGGKRLSVLGIPWAKLRGREGGVYLPMREMGRGVEMEKCWWYWCAWVGDVVRV